MATSNPTVGGASTPDLSSSLISFQTIRENAKQTLLDILETAPCPQALIVDPALTNPISLICPVKEMRLHKVQEILLLGGEERTKVYQSFHTIFLLRPSPELILQTKDIIFHQRKRITQQQAIHAARDPTAIQQRATFSIYFVPRRSLICESILHKYELTNDKDITIGEFPLDLIPCDYDLLSLELPNTFTRVFIDGDTTALFTIALSIIRLQVFFGIVPLIKGVGKASHRVAELIHRLSCELLVTSRLHKIDFGGKENSFCGIANETNTAESSSYNIFASLNSGSVNLEKLNNSIIGSLALSSSTNTNNNNNNNPSTHNLTQVTLAQQQRSSLSTQLSSLLNITADGVMNGLNNNNNPEVATTNNNNNNNDVTINSTNPQQLSDIDSRNRLDNNNNNNNNNDFNQNRDGNGDNVDGGKIGSGGDNDDDNGPVIPNPYDVTKPRVNITYAQNPIINGYTLPQITQVMLIDRTADMISPMLLQRTYEGLLDEIYGINTQTIEYDPDQASLDESSSAGLKSTPKSSQQQQQQQTLPAGKKKKMSLHNGDVLFSELRDVNIKVLGQLFTEKWSYIKRTYAQTDDLISDSNVKVADMEKMVKQFKNAHIEHQLLPIHWGFAQKIREFFASRYINQLKDIEEALLVDNDIAMVEKWIDEAIMKIVPLNKILRVVILYAAMYGTINKKKTELWCRDIIQTYGLEMSPLLSNLQHIGILFNTAPITDDQQIHQSMLTYGLTAMTSSKFMQPQTPEQGQLLQQKRDLLVRMIETTKLVPSNDMNFHLAIARSGSSPNAPILRKPLWDKLVSRLKLVQTEAHLTLVQQAAFNRHGTYWKSNIDNAQEAKHATIQTLMREPIDVNFGYGNFYSPLSIRFVEMAAQPGGLKRLQDQLQIQSLLFSTPYNNNNNESITSSITSTIFSSSLVSGTNNEPLNTVLHVVPQLAPASTSPHTPVVALPQQQQQQQQVSVSTGGMNDNITNTANYTITPPSVFEYRQALPHSLQQRMKIPDQNYFNYPLLSTTLVPSTPQQISQQSQIDSSQSQFLPNETPKSTNRHGPQTQQQHDQSQQDQPQHSENDVLGTDDAQEETKRVSSKPICLVYFIGGATHAEVGMLRYLTDHPTHKYAYIVATTKMVNSKTIINDLQHGVKDIGKNYD